MSVVSSSLASIHGPGNPGEVMPPAYFFLGNFPPGGRVGVRTAWATDVIMADVLAEERRGLMSRPGRVLNYSTFSKLQEEAFQLEALAQRRSQLRSMVPLHSDKASVSGPSGSGPVLNVETTAHRRFFPGQRALYLDPDRQGTPGQPNFVIGTILTVGATALTFAATVGGNLATARGRVYPLIEAAIAFRTQHDALTDWTIQLEVEAIEVRGESALPGLVEPNTIPSGWQEHDGLPILDIKPQFPIRNQPQRIGSAQASGRSSIDGPLGDRALWRKSCRWKFLTRATAWPLLEFFDSRGGATFPFWLPTWMDHWIGDDLQLGWIDIEQRGIASVYDLSNYDHIGLRLNDGTWIIRGIDSTEEPSGDEVYRILFDTDIPATSLDDVDLICGVLKARFESDEITEDWTSDEVVDITADISEVIEEKTIDIGDPLNTITGDMDATAPGAIAGLSGWYDVGIAALSSKSRGTITGDDDITPWRQCESCLSWVDTESSNHLAVFSEPTWRRACLWLKDLSGNNQHMYEHGNGSPVLRPRYSAVSAFDPTAFDIAGMPFLWHFSGGRLSDLYQTTVEYAWHHATNGLTVFAVGGNLPGRSGEGSDFQLNDQNDLALMTATDRWQLRTDGFQVTPAGGGAAVGADLGSGVGRWAWSIFVGRWQPSTRIDFWRRPAQLWLDGGPFPENVNPTGSDVVSSIQVSQSVGVPAAMDAGGAGYTAGQAIVRYACFIMYARFLSAAEINAVGAYLGERYTIPWFDVTL